VTPVPVRLLRASLAAAFVFALPTLRPATAGDEGAPVAATSAADEAPSPARVREAIRRGVEFLVRTQRGDGSWGSPAPNLFLDIYSPVPAAYHAYQIASSALALSALLEVGGTEADVAAAVAKGRDWLVAHHTRARRAKGDVLYNNWAHLYALDAFARLLGREREAEARAPLLRAAREAVDLLVRYEYVDGGWGYYDFAARTRTPSTGYSTSFTTGAALVALRRAADAGVEVPERIVRRARASIRAVQFPSGAFGYSFSHRLYPQGGINKIQGSLARTPVCYEGLVAWGEPLPEARIVRALEDLEKDGHFLRIARKYPIPHESWYQNSGYFCFFGYYYAALLLPRVPEDVRRFHAGRIAHHLLPLQEEDGSWWDYQLFGFHKPYGTGFVLLTLGRTLEAAGAGPGAE
jgi:hypothetical protein